MIPGPDHPSFSTELLGGQNTVPGFPWHGDTGQTGPIGNAQNSLPGRAFPDFAMTTTTLIEHYCFVTRSERLLGSSTSVAGGTTATLPHHVPLWLARRDLVRHCWAGANFN